MINKSIVCYLFLLVFRIRLLGAQVPNTSNNQGNSSRFPDLGAMGFPNFGSGRFPGNPTSNYPMNSFFPFGNQNNMQRPGLGPQENFQNRPIQGYPNQQRYPYQGDNMNPGSNYQQPQYQNYQNRPIQGGSQNQDSFPYQGDNMQRYPNYQRPSYPNRPNDPSIYSGNINRPYQNGGMPSNEDGSFNRPYQYPPQGDQYPSQGNFQGNPNIRPNQINPNFRPDDLNSLINPNIQFPNRPYQNQPNQYYPQTGLPYQNNQGYRPGFGPNNYQPYPSYNNPNTNIQFPTNNQGVNEDPAAIQFPDQGTMNPGNFNNVPQNPPQFSNNQGMNTENNPNPNDTAAILGKPVVVPPTSAPAQVVIDNSTESPAQKKCVQDCPTTSEYNPLCGTNNVTYINPGKFYCAQKCGEQVSLRKEGRCDDDIAPNGDNQ